MLLPVVLELQALQLQAVTPGFMTRAGFRQILTTSSPGLGRSMKQPRLVRLPVLRSRDCSLQCGVARLIHLGLARFFGVIGILEQTLLLCRECEATLRLPYLKDRK